MNIIDALIVGFFIVIVDADVAPVFVTTVAVVYLSQRLSPQSSDWGRGVGVGGGDVGGGDKNGLK